MVFSLEGWHRAQETDLAVVQSFGAFSPGGEYLASADANTIEVRETRGGSIVGTVEMLGVTSLAVSRDGKLLVAADDDGSVSAWGLGPVSPLWRAHLTLPPPAYAQVVYDVQFASNGDLAVASKPAGVNNTLVEVWPIEPRPGERPQPSWQSVMLNSDYQTFSPSPDGSRVLLVTEDGYWILLPNNERVFVDGFYDSGDHAVVAFSADGRQAVGIEPEGGWTYDVVSHSMREIDDMAMLEEPTDVGWSPDGSAVLITSEDGLSVCAQLEAGFAYLGVLDSGAGFEAAAFIDATTIAAKRGDTLIVFSQVT